jgi:hypothetical protein
MSVPLAHAVEEDLRDGLTDGSGISRQRLRLHRVDADRSAVVRRLPTLHPDDGDSGRLLLGTSISNNASLAAAWCVTITVVGYVWVKKLYNRDPSR